MILEQTEPQVQKDLRAFRVSRETSALEASRVLKAIVVLKDLRDRKASKVQKASRAIPDRRVSLEQTEPRAPKDSRASRDSRAIPDHKVSEVSPVSLAQKAPREQMVLLAQTPMSQHT